MSKCPVMMASGLVVLVVVCGGQAFAERMPSVPKAEVYFVNLKNNARVKSPFKVVFGVSGMGVAPAGVDYPRSGHHHLLINRPPFGQGEDGEDEYIYNLPADANHVHFGKGQTETVPEANTPCNWSLPIRITFHMPHDPPLVSEVITIGVR